MSFKERLIYLREEIFPTQSDVQGWLLYDFRRSNTLACQFLEIPEEKLLTRRFFYWIPVEGELCKIVHAIEQNVLDHLPGKVITYRSWEELETALAITLKGIDSVAMEYSPRNILPYISKVDGGTIDLVRGFGIHIVSSANFLQHFVGRWDAGKIQSHLEAAAILDQIAQDTWEMIHSHLNQGKNITEFMVQQFILKRFEDQQCETADAPICAVNQNSANPHYMPNCASSSPILHDDFILIDLWCKKRGIGHVYADITRVGFAGVKPNRKHQDIFRIVREAQSKCIEFVRESFHHGITIRGWEVDQKCRDVINHAGYGEYFIHRTGHHIDTSDHGDGVHMDNYETHDDRVLLPRTCFSVEPGIYLPNQFGVRLECDVLIHADLQIQVTGGEQDEIICLF